MIWGADGAPSNYGVIDWAGVQNTISEPRKLRYMVTMLK